jgi:hypothetical protein
MDRRVGLEAVDGHQPVAVEDGGVVVAQLDDHEEVQRVGVVHGARGQIARVGKDPVGRGDAVLAPDGRLGRRGEDVVGELGRPVPVDLPREGGHLARRTAGEDGVAGPLGGEPSQGLRDQGRSGPAQAVGAVAGGAQALEGPIDRLGRGGR